ncbi:hypothetical protein MTBGP_11180 [Moorella thermoacetica]|uniref:DUF3006 domain-containing protein n=1 Tax=Neomoorella thermoacetica TaxID=1525 RepID=UPI0030CE6681
MFIIDRFEGQWAVIETDDRKTFNLPRSILPCDAKEGDVVTLIANINRRDTEMRREKAQSLLDNFFDE